MITSRSIREGFYCNHGVDWVTCLRSADISALINERVQPSFFDVTDMSEIEHPDYLNERLIVCRNPLLKEERARKREALPYEMNGQKKNQRYSYQAYLELLSRS